VLRQHVRARSARTLYSLLVVAAATLGGFAVGQFALGSSAARESSFGAFNYRGLHYSCTYTVRRTEIGTLLPLPTLPGSAIDWRPSRNGHSIAIYRLHPHGLPDAVVQACLADRTIVDGAVRQSSRRTLLQVRIIRAQVRLGTLLLAVSLSGREAGHVTRIPFAVLNCERHRQVLATSASRLGDSAVVRSNERLTGCVRGLVSVRAQTQHVYFVSSPRRISR
jgi:hypothetical protein